MGEINRRQLLVGGLSVVGVPALRPGALGHVPFEPMGDAQAPLTSELSGGLHRGEVVRHLMSLLALSPCSFHPVTEAHHGLQAATRASVLRPQDDELMVAALCHDVGSLFGAKRGHAAASASLLSGYIRPELVAVIQHHSLFQRRYHPNVAPESPGALAHRRFEGEPWFDLALFFSDELDQPSFDPEFPTYTFEDLSPVVMDVFSRRRHSA